MLESKSMLKVRVCYIILFDSVRKYLKRKLYYH